MVNVSKPTIVNLNHARRGVAARDAAARMALGDVGPSHTMSFYSILFETAQDRSEGDPLSPPAFFVNLNCDQVVAAITAGKDEYNLKPFFHSRLHRVDAVNYRHDVIRDLDDTPLHERVNSFAQTMHAIREYLARVAKLYYREQQQAWFLNAVDIYCQAITSLAHDLNGLGIKSRGFIGFRDYVVRYAGSSPFKSLVSETRNLKADLATVDYCVHIKGNGFTVRKTEGEADYSAEVEATFAKFKQGAARDYLVKFSENADMNHVEAKILEFVAKLHPQVFGALEDFCVRHSEFIDGTIATFDREVQFYIAYLEYIANLRRAGLRFCYPHVSNHTKEVYDNDGFDIALAHKLVAAGSSVVCNDFYLKGNERILVVSGPNQGGKTTFARAFGQLHYLANVGLPVPGREAQLFLFDKLFTHFEKEEKVENLRGKLEDDLVRVRGILDEATPQSIIILNEVFTSTTIQDETFLSSKVMEQIIDLGLLCVWVTFVDELASFSPQTVSMVSTVVPENPALRTFKVVRRPADGLAYAMAIAQKYALTYDAIRERMRP
jgi:DNA mismatch repair protein MutS